MRTEPILTIIGMALVTYSTRIGGFWLMSRITLSPRVEAWLAAIPSAVLVALVAPTVLTTGAPEAVASMATVVTAIRTRNLLLAIVVGVVAVWALRHLLTGHA